MGRNAAEISVWRGKTLLAVEAVSMQHMSYNYRTQVDSLVGEALHKMFE